MDAAIGWMIRVRDPDFVDWEGFAAWMARDPAHAEAYQAAAAADAQAGTLTPPAPGPVIVQTLRRTWLPWGVAGAAAAAAALVGYISLPAPVERYAVATAAGEQRRIELEPGTSLVLNGATRVTLDRRDRRFAALEAGEAYFDVRHDAARPFRVETAGATLVDAGTRFAVEREAQGWRLAVAEGLVIVDPAQANVRVGAGQNYVRQAGGRATQGRVAPEAIGAWREGRLLYDGVPLAEVADDLSRSLGVRIVAEPAVAAQPFSGAITLDAAMRRDPRELGPLLGVTVTRAGGGWVLARSR